MAGFTNNDVAEYAATVATQQTGFFVNPLPTPGGIYLNGFLLPFLAQQPPTGVAPGPSPGAYGVGPYSGMPEPEGLAGGTECRQRAERDRSRQHHYERGSYRDSDTRRYPLYPTDAEMVISDADLNGTILGLNRMHSARIW